MGRVAPPDDISPEEFFTRWIGEAVAADESRRRRLGETRARVVFELHGEGDEGGCYTVHIEAGCVTGRAGRAPEPDLHVQVDVETWRGLNRGDISAPEALLKRRVRLTGDWKLGLKLHLILG